MQRVILVIIERIFAVIYFMGLVKQIFEIIKRHLGDTVTVIIKNNNGLFLHTGYITEINEDRITLAEEPDSETGIELNFENEGEQKIMHIYNTHQIDLMNARKTQTLAEKLKDKEKKKVIFSSLKPFLQNRLYFVYRNKKVMHCSSGLFYNMGIMGISLKLPPFFNQDLNLPYDTILHIYSSDFKDLII